MYHADYIDIILHTQPQPAITMWAIWRDAECGGRETIGYVWREEDARLVLEALTRRDQSDQGNKP